MQINQFKGKSEEEILVAAEKVFADDSISKEDKFRELMLICEFSRDPKNRRTISGMAHKNASCPEEAMPALKVMVSPEYTETVVIAQQTAQPAQ